MENKQVNFDMDDKFIVKMNKIIDVLVDVCLVLSVACVVVNVIK